MASESLSNGDGIEEGMPSHKRVTQYFLPSNVLTIHIYLQNDRVQLHNDFISN